MTEGKDGTFLKRMRAAVRGERSAATLEGMRRASQGVFEELALADRHRNELLTGDGSLWRPPPATATHLLATWNAYVLHTLGAKLLDSYYAAHPGTAGYVAPETFEQVWWWLGSVQGWLSRARQARSNPDYDIRRELRLPVDLPPWSEAKPVPPEHISAMLDAAPAVREQAEYAVFALEKGEPPEDSRAALNRLRQLLADASTAADYADGLSAGRTDTTLTKLSAQNLRRAMGIWFHVGQLAAFPTLAGRYGPPRAPARMNPEALPGRSGFDPWCLTDPASRAEWQADHRARRAIAHLWQHDPNPSATLQLKAEVDLSVRNGDIVPIRLPGGVTCYFRCPWSSLYEVRRPVTIAGRRMGVLQQFTLDISADGMVSGRPFVRRIVMGPFQVTYVSGSASARDNP